VVGFWKWVLEIVRRKDDVKGFQVLNGLTEKEFAGKRVCWKKSLLNLDLAPSAPARPTPQAGAKRTSGAADKFRRRILRFVSVPVRQITI